MSQIPDGVIPYVDHHDGPRRLLVVDLTTGNAMIRGKIPPIVSIDGRRYLVYWGAVRFEVPADRACHVSVHVEGERLAQHASVLLTPGERGETVRLHYATNYGTGIGTLVPVA